MRDFRCGHCQRVVPLASYWTAFRCVCGTVWQLNERIGSWYRKAWIGGQA